MMATNITQLTLKLTQIFFFLTLYSCSASDSVLPLKNRIVGTLIYEKKHEIKTILSQTNEEQTKGVSGIKNEQWKDNLGMLFVYDKPGTRAFWMPDTYFDLDIIFLDEKLKILNIHRNVKAHPGRKNPALIPRTEPIFSRHVLEIKANSPLSNHIKVGGQFTWKGPRF